MSRASPRETALSTFGAWAVGFRPYQVRNAADSDGAVVAGAGGAGAGAVVAGAAADGDGGGLNTLLGMALLLAWQAAGLGALWQ
jgi:hypothetical protein